MIPLEPCQTPNRVFGCNRPALSSVIPPTMHAGHSLQKHGKKNHVHADECRPKVHLTPKIVHLSTGRFREPIVNTCKKSEDRPRRNDVMEMRDDVVGVVQVK